MQKYNLTYKNFHLNEYFYVIFARLKAGQTYVRWPHLFYFCHSKSFLEELPSHVLFYTFNLAFIQTMMHNS